MIADRPQYESYTDVAQWLEIRKTAWGSSDTGAALGISRHKTNVVATLEKQGKLEPEDLSQNPYIKRGKRLEPVVAEMVEEELGVKLQRVNRVRRHREYPMLASIDRAIVGTRFKRIVEIKTAGIFTAHEYGDSGTDEVPSDVYAQAVTQNIVYDADEVIVAALFGLDDLRFYPIKRDAATEKVVIDGLIEAWAHVVNGTLPAPKAYVDVVRMFPKHAERAIAADEVLREAFDAYRELKRFAKETDSALEPLQAQIAAFLGECDTLMIDDEPALTWRTQVSRRFSESAFKVDHPELHAQYVRDLQTRVMRLKGKL